MSARGQFARRFLIAVALGYAALDGLLLHGPLRRQVESFIPGSPASLDRARSRGILAIIADTEITSSQRDRAVEERLWTEGKSSADIPPDELAAVRASALDDLILDAYLRDLIRHAPQPPLVPDEEINERLRRLVGRFETKGAMEKAMKSQGIRDESALRRRIAATIQQEKWISSVISNSKQITDAEARGWLAQHPQAASIPERIKARHVFLPTLDHPPQEAEQKLKEALTALSAGTADFASLARTISEDPATRETGGDMGWMSRDRLPPDLAAPLFSMPIAHPQLVRSSLGWHLIEVTERKSPSTRSFEQMKPEIIAALQSAKRRTASDNYRKSLRAAASQKAIKL